VRSVEESSREGGAIAVLPGERTAADRLRDILQVPATDLATGAGMLVHPAVPGVDHSAPAAALARHKAAGGGVLALLVGRRGQRAVMERAFVAQEGLGLGDLAHVLTLDGEAGAKEAVEAVVEALGEDRVAAARSAPSLRDAVADRLIDGAARQAAAVGALIFLPGADMPVLTLLQVRLAIELAAVYDRPVGSDRALEVAALFGAGFGWRALGRAGAGVVPGPGWALKGGLAYGATKAVGEAARAWYAEGGDLAERPVEGLREKLEGLVSKAKAMKAKKAA